MDYELFGTFNGRVVKIIPLAEFLSHMDILAKVDCFWLIQEDNKLIYQGDIVGQVAMDGNIVHKLHRLPCEIFYRKHLTKTKEAGGEAFTSSRPSLESLVAKSAKVLKDLSGFAAGQIEFGVYKGNESLEKMKKA